MSERIDRMIYKDITQSRKHPMAVILIKSWPRGSRLCLSLLLAVTVGIYVIPGPATAPAVSLSSADRLLQGPPQCANVPVPRKPAKPMVAHGATLEISGPKAISSGASMPVRISIVNRGLREVPVIGLIPPWVNFPGNWCWGPKLGSRTTVLRNVRGGFRSFVSGSAMASGALPGKSFTVSLPLNLAHVFDLSLPGKYEAQIAGLDMVSNVIKFRVLSPNDKPVGSILPEVTAVPKNILWGQRWHGVQIAAYAELNPGVAEPIMRVHLFFRCAGKRVATLRLTGNPPDDFLRCALRGPYLGRSYNQILKYRRINGQPVPMTAFGRKLATAPAKGPVKKSYTLLPRKAYTYWAPLVLNRWYDLSYYGLYRFRAKLAGTGLMSGAIPLYVGVQPRVYKDVDALFRKAP